MKLKQNNENIKNVIFDFGNVILDIDIALTVEAFRKLGITGFSVEDIHPNTKDFFLNLELGNISPEEFIAQIKESYSEAQDIEDDKIWGAWNILLLEYDPQRIELLKELSKSYNLYLLSNTNLPHRIFFMDKFKKQFGIELESLFTECFYSDAMHLRKPDKNIYQQLIDKTGVNPTQTLFIDDNYCNFSGAEEVGLNWYHLTGKETILDLFE